MFFDPKTFTNDQLFEKQLELVRKKIMSARFGNVDTTTQIQNMIDAIDNERRERMFTDIIGSYMKSSPAVTIETDPFLKEHDAAEAEIELEKHPKPVVSKPVRRPVRTLRPVNLKDG
jgi:glutamyl-tRNA reductase